MGATCSVYTSRSQQLTYDELINLLEPDFDKKLSEEAHHELYFISTYAYHAYQNIILEIKNKNLQILPYHFNQIFHLIRLEKRIFSNIFFEQLKKSCELIDIHNIENQRLLNTMYHDFEEHIKNQSLQNHLLHHALPHALEVEHRLDVNLKKFNLLDEKDSFTQLIRHITLLMAKYHDLIQIQVEHYPTTEEHTASVLKKNLCQVFNIEAEHPLSLFINYLADLVIVTGTTIIREQSMMHQMDLSRLFLEFRDLTCIYHPFDFSEEVQNIHQSFGSIVLLMSIIDKYPAALIETTHSQLQLSNHDCLEIREKPVKLKELFWGMMKQQMFMQKYSSAFYFQAFLIAIVPHIAMQFEFFAKKNPTEALSMLSFIDMCRENLIQNKNKLSWLKEPIAQRNILYFISEIFIKKIQQEIKFCKSLESGLDFAKTYFDKNHHLVLDGLYDTILQINIEFLKKLDLFFLQSEFQIRFKIMEELFLNLIIQKGFVIEMQMKKPVEMDSTRTNVNRFSSSLFILPDNLSSVHTEHLRYNT